MPPSTYPAEPAPPDLPLAELAGCARPAPRYAALRDAGVHHRDGVYLVARPDDVDAALVAPELAVIPPGRPDVSAAGRLRARMARFSDGPDHARRRSLARALLPDPDRAARAAAAETVARVGDRGGPVDVMPVARTVPVAVLAAALGVDPTEIDRVVMLTGRLCDAFAPVPRPTVSPAEADAAAEGLRELLRPAVGSAQERLAAAAGLLFQARDATAALIGSALLADDSPAEPDRRIETVLRRQAPVQSTRRWARADLLLGGALVPRGAEVWLLLAAAETPGRSTGPATFGGGPHACPGRTLAAALARGVVGAVLDRGFRPVPGQPVAYEARPNLRLPVRVLVARP
ncbi:cytochrome P450 [Plantactinospora sonchi]|uniref:Cytochrome P450 n=1 Tax=Plantactinospora sonchi TaxID=1544735 RepID=A0ABU7S5H4_9ACTN